MKQIIAVDIDDVLADSTTALRNVVNSTYNLSITDDAYTVSGGYHKYYERVWERAGHKNVVSKEYLNQMMIENQSHINVHQGAHEAINKLSKNYDLLIVTARNQSWEQATYDWVDFNFPGTFQSIVFGGQRNDPEQRTKGQVCKQYGVNWLIDDNVVHCTDAYNSSVTPILFGNYGWQLDIPNYINRCENWDEIIRYFNSFTDTTLRPGFKSEVERIVHMIPPGRVMTYGQLAALAGSPLAARIVGGIAHFGDPDLPWQRVVNKKGGMASGYPGGRSAHQAALIREDIVFINEYVANISSLLWWPPNYKDVK